MKIDTSGFKELYAKLISCIPKDILKDLSIFFPQVGQKYFDEDKRILFIGKSCNSWFNESFDIDELFDKNNKNRIVNREDEGIYKLARNDVPGYNSNLSAFLRFMKKLALTYYDKEDWYNYIAWTNLYKVSPAVGGNPSSDLCNMQYKQCIDILNKEIEYFDPYFLIFLTSSWENSFLESMGLSREKNQSIKWDSNETYYQNFNNRIYIQSQHPQTRKEQPHIDAIIEILKQNFS